MRAWIDDRGLTVVSGAGCSPAEAVTRRSGPNASEIDYVVVDAGRGVDAVACATDGDDDARWSTCTAAGRTRRTTARSTRGYACACSRRGGRPLFPGGACAGARRTTRRGALRRGAGIAVSVVAWSAAAWGKVPVAASTAVRQAETEAFRFALGAASTGVSHVAMATLLGEVTADGASGSGTVSAGPRAAARAARSGGPSTPRSRRRLRRPRFPASRPRATRAGPSGSSRSAGDDRASARAVGRAAREYAERQAAGVSDLALFRAVRPSREWRRTWILEQRAGDRRSPLVAVLGGACRLAPQTRLVRVEDAYGRQGREAAARWWRGARAPALSSCSDVGFAAFLAASGAPPPSGGLAELRDDLARAFASTFGEFFVAHASEITALPPRRST
ncbi:hypothetical protein JL720_3085 [Aureococcus anophagefferens]|nr:hypothetical protein JL720_3085 [Aureococcus anophagefferens]